MDRNRDVRVDGPRVAQRRVALDDPSGGGGPVGAGELLRPGRALLGWLTDLQAARALGHGRDDAVLDAEQRGLVDSARAHVSARLVVDRTPAGIVSDLPSELDRHEAELRATIPSMFDEGWRLRLVDLAGICALQPVVHVDHSLGRTAGIESDDLPALAELTVPTAHRAPLRASFDEARNAWVIVSPNRNLRLIGRFTAPVAGSPVSGLGADPPGFGFVVTVVPSYLQVAEFRGRHVLRDGYHRAIGLLARGIRVVPALVIEADAVEQVTVAGALPQEAYMGAAPATLPDYLDDAVSADVWLPAARKMVLIQGMEIDFLA